MSFGNPTDSVKNMNQWVEKQTNNKIKNFLEADKIDMNTYLFLINALYFKGMWKHSFDKNKTFDKSFYVDNNTPKNVPTMQVTSEIFYKSHEGLGAEIVRLPYQAKDGCDPMSMIIILPNWEQSLSDIQKKLNTVTLESLYPTDKSKMHLYLMGIKDAFTSKANFHGITEQNDISISKVIQQAFIEVNEDGTKAAAATHMGIMPLSAYGGPLDIHVNRPFLFLLATERVILFTGYVNDPTTK
ncbi:serpin B3-like [Aphidius gifuensis]|uniref:serpin B3-like n=1 Tax=Aphidius gifuensis TaxID=684658 RepID=UPI001CDB6839|nr:serpin B3-like [Aphidius gifuensis]